MSAYYNEINPFAASWLKELIKAGLIAPGEVDERSIEDVVPGDLNGFDQCHFFAGIGVWSFALRQAGWPDERPVWTGSCPCQPFSTAGKGKGFADERHLWPAFFHLISQCRPVTIFGEQVASNDGLGWLDLVQADLEGAGYSCGALDTCAAGFGAPHIRQRLYWVAHPCDIEKSSIISGRLGDAIGKGLERQSRDGHRARSWQETSGYASKTGNPDGLANAESGKARQELREPDITMRRRPLCLPAGCCVASPDSSQTDSFWKDADWLFCRDGKWRPVEPGSCPLAHGAASRVGRLRGYGNAIVAPQAEAFIRAFMEVELGNNN